MFLIAVGGGRGGGWGGLELVIENEADGVVWGSSFSESESVGTALLFLGRWLGWGLRRRGGGIAGSGSAQRRGGIEDPEVELRFRQHAQLRISIPGERRMWVNWGRECGDRGVGWWWWNSHADTIGLELVANMRNCGWTLGLSM